MRNFRPAKVATLDVALMEKMSTKRLLSVYKKVRSLRNRLKCDCGCGEPREMDKDEYYFYDGSLNTIKRILDKRENV